MHHDWMMIRMQSMINSMWKSFIKGKISIGDKFQEEAVRGDDVQFQE